MSLNSEKPTILLQLDTDPQPSVFDAIVATDAGVDRLIRHYSLEREQVQSLVHGAMFTRSPAELKRTAIFVGGSNVSKAEEIFAEVRMTFFDPFRVSVLLDPNGANTTAAAAVLCAAEAAGDSLAGLSAAVLGGTGPVGQRVARLLAFQGAKIAVGSREYGKAHSTAKTLSEILGADVGFFATADTDQLAEGLANAAPHVVVAAGAAGAVLLPLSVRRNIPNVRVLIDLNAVPPAGIEGVKTTDRGVDRDGVKCWGALGVGGLKLKIHKRAIQQLFESNDQVFDAEEILDLGKKIAKS